MSKRFVVETISDIPIARPLSVARVSKARYAVKWYRPRAPQWGRWMSKLHECEVAKLHPTQITVGMIEVHDKREHLSKLGHHERHGFLTAHPIPAVFGPGGHLYITDHHHLARALWEENIESGVFLVEADFTEMHPLAFWSEMDARHWVHPVDAQGKRHGVDALPHHVKGLVDDPYRSLAGYVRNAGGFEKTPTAFAEFLRADFFRHRVRIGPHREGFEAAVRTALTLAHGPEARPLPGFVPPAKS
jgi:hypothetical protein